MTELFHRRTLIKQLNTLLDPTRHDMKSTPDMSWVLPMLRDTLFEETLRLANGNQREAAQMLGVSRGTYAKHIKRITTL
ncbi:conserved hypothetical protein [Vibrio owensii]|uniref:DNA binding HTH domain-containing protein n=1 Tax=Vibrio owensii TaxID=696485 RepID=A0AAU9Q5M7_9VIBR|nr:conserved hypothetical protein [Vibrio owensii]